MAAAVAAPAGPLHSSVPGRAAAKPTWDAQHKLPTKTPARPANAKVQEILDVMAPGKGQAGQTMPGQNKPLLRWERAWCIQDALDQHSNLNEQRQIFSQLGEDRLRANQESVQVAYEQVAAALNTARQTTPEAATSAQKINGIAGQLQVAVRDFRLAQRLMETVEAQVRLQFSWIEEDLEKSCQELTSLKEVVDDKSLAVAQDDHLPSQIHGPDGRQLQQKFKYCTNCKVGGHGQRFCRYLLERSDWRVYPHQSWFQDETKNEYWCPLGKKLVDFADESHFSRVAMYLKGRAWLEDKTKVLELVPDLMPETYIIEGQKWKNGKCPPSDDEVDVLPWFVKEADRNWGTSIHLCSKPSECIKVVGDSMSTFVVQQHVKDPLLMSDGRKSHIKFYNLLVGHEDGVRWSLYTYQDGYLSISPNPWSPTDISKETQVTIIRSGRSGTWEPWAESYPKCKEGVKQLMKKAIDGRRLEPRPGKRQFEIFSADFLIDTSGKAWFFEFNMSPVLKDHTDDSANNDADMIRGALSIVFPHRFGNPGLWEFAGEYNQPQNHSGATSSSQSP